MSSTLAAEAASGSTEMQRAGITWRLCGNHMAPGVQPAQGAHSMSCGSGKVFYMAFPSPGFLGRLFPGGRDGEIPGRLTQRYRN